MVFIHLHVNVISNILSHLQKPPLHLCSAGFYMILSLKHVFIQLNDLFYQINMVVVFLSDELILFATKHDQNVSAGNVVGSV